MTNKKTKIILDAGDDTALLVEQSQPVNTALMIPVSESAIFQKFIKRQVIVKSFKIFMVCAWLLSFLLIKNSIDQSALQETTLNIVYFFLIGIAGFGSVVLLKSLSNVFDIPKDVLFIEYAREEIRNMKNNKTKVEEYFIDSSYLHIGIEGDFITLYKQEKNRKQDIQQ